jgi:hypothetical protein
MEVRFRPRSCHDIVRKTRHDVRCARRKTVLECDRVESGGVKETHRDDNPSYSCLARCCDIARRWSTERDRCAPERGRNLSSMVRSLFRPRRPQLRLRVVPTMRDDGDPRHRRLVRAKSLVPVVRTEQLERRGPHRPAQAAGVTSARHSRRTPRRPPRAVGWLRCGSPQRTWRNARSFWPWTIVKGRKG